MIDLSQEEIQGKGIAMMSRFEPASKYCLGIHEQTYLSIILSTTNSGNELSKPHNITVSRARRLKYVWSRLPCFCKRRQNVGDTNQIAERSIITQLLRVSHMTVCPFQTRCYREKSVSESCELAMLRPNQERVISFKIKDGFCRWCLKCTGQLEQNRKHMLCRLTVKISTFLRRYR